MQVERPLVQNINEKTKRLCVCVCSHAAWSSTLSHTTCALTSMRISPSCVRRRGAFRSTCVLPTICAPSRRSGRQRRITRVTRALSPVASNATLPLNATSSGGAESVPVTRGCPCLVCVIGDADHRQSARAVWTTSPRRSNGRTCRRPPLHRPSSMSSLQSGGAVAARACALPRDVATGDEDNEVRRPSRQHGGLLGNEPGPVLGATHASREHVCVCRWTRWTQRAWEGVRRERKFDAARVPTSVCVCSQCRIDGP